LEGRRLTGVPADAGDFIPVDGHGRVTGLEHVYAAGDGTAFPIKQGGLATQQADAVAETIAAAAGAPVTPEPFRPVLRGVLLTGGDDRFMRFDVAGGRGDPEVATHALWWPPTKIAGRYLAPFLFGRDELETSEHIRDEHLPVEADLGLVASASGP
jgi:sulfide:quinone oxidoreductase